MAPRKARSTVKAGGGKARGKARAKRKVARRPAKAPRATARKSARKAAPKPAAKRATASALPLPEPLRAAKREADVVDVPARVAIAIEGEGSPHGEPFGRSVGALYGVAYTLKLALKARGKDFKIGPLEGRWWAEGASLSADGGPPPPESWRWRLRIAVPADVDEHLLADVIQGATTKPGGRLEGNADARRVALERIPAARLGRILHVGPYSEEEESFEKIRGALAGAGLRGSFAHLEVYLSDPRRTAPAKLKTVLLRELAG